MPEFTHRFSWRNPKPQKSVCVVRFGGFGDMIQTAQLFPELKKKWEHLTVMTTPKGQDVIRHDPNVDAWHIQDQDQVPNTELGPYWKSVAKRYTKFINLSECVEGTWLALPGHMKHSWPQSVRHARLNVNYAEFMAELADAPMVPAKLFYPTKEEAEWAKAQKAKWPGYLILWVLAGSSIHKVYPGMDAAIAKIMVGMPEAKVVLVGDEACRLLEQGWENESRVLCMSGKWSIRQTLAFAQVVNCVTGPETGVLNSVAFDSSLKVVTLSHSSRENLTKHWNNTEALEPEGQHCYPCHQLHYGDQFCDVDPESHVAMCQFKIAPQRVYEPMQRDYEHWKAMNIIFPSKAA